MANHECNCDGLGCFGWVLLIWLVYTVHGIAEDVKEIKKALPAKPVVTESP